MHTLTLPEDSIQAVTEPGLRIVVLAGGPSAERSVSLQSGSAVAGALRRRGHEVIERDIGPRDLSALDLQHDVVFPALHGTFGEDGGLQRLMQDRGLRFVGSRADASACAMDKWSTKQLARQIGLDTPPAEIWDPARQTQEGLPSFGLPLVVKPVDQGSSVATFIVKQEADFGPAVHEVIRQFGQALIEQFIAGREITVGIVGTQVLPAIWIRPKRAFYDFAAKYEDDATEYLFDTGLPSGVVAALQAASRRLFERMGCRHLGRIDWIVDDAQRAWLLEVNTMPGFTSHSLVPMAAARAGIPFDELVDRLVHMAYREPAA